MTARRGRARGWALGLAVAVVALLLLPAPATAQQAPAASVAFRDASPYVAQAGGTYTLEFAMTNAPVDSRIVFAVGYPLTVENNDRDVLDAMVAGKLAPRQLGAVTLPAILFLATDPDTAEHTARFPIAQGGDAPANGFTLTDPGVYPLTVTLIGGDDAKLSSFTTFMIVLAATTVTTPLALASIVPFSAPLALQPDGTYVMSDDDGRRLSAVTKVMDDNPAAGITLHPTPETVDALAQVGTANAPNAAQLADAVGTRQVLSGPYVDLDPNAWAKAGLNGELDDQLALGSQVLETSAAGGRPLDTGTWFADQRLTAEALDQLSAVGTDRLVLRDGVGPLDPKVFDGAKHAAAQFAEQQPFDVQNDAGRRFRAVLTDKRLAGRLSATTNAAENAQLALADLALIYCGPVVKTNCQSLPRIARSTVLEVDPTPVALASFGALLKLVATRTDGLPTPMITTAGLRTVFDGEAASAGNGVAERPYEAASPDGVPSMDAYRTEVRRLSPLVSGYQSMVTGPDEGRGTAVRRLLDVSGADMDAERQRAYLLSANHQVVTVADAISAPAQEPATLTSTDAVLQVRIDNRLDYRVTVRLEVSSDKLEFSDGKQSTTIDQVLEPNETTGVKVDVKARASGTFSLDARITSPDETLHLDEASLEVRSTAVSQLGLVLTICAGFFLLAWWIKHFRATRRSKKLIEPAEADRLRHESEREHEPA